MISNVILIAATLVLVAGFIFMYSFLSDEEYTVATRTLIVGCTIFWVGILIADKVDNWESHYSDSATTSEITVTAYHFSEKQLIYDNVTSIVYIRSEYGIIPYLSENGNPCRFVNGKIVDVKCEEITETFDLAKREN